MFNWFDNKQWKYDDLPTPITNDDYTELAFNTLEKRLAVINSDDWELIKDGDITVEQKPMDNSNVNIIRVTSVLKNRNITELKNILFKPSLEDRKKLYDGIVDFNIIKVINGTIIVGKTILKYPPVTDREFLSMRTYKQLDQDNYLIGIQSINMSSVGFDENCVRGSSDCGILLTQEGDNVRIISVDHIDPRGWIPTIIINSFSEIAGDWIRKL